MAIHLDAIAPHSSRKSNLRPYCSLVANQREVEDRWPGWWIVGLWIAQHEARPTQAHARNKDRPGGTVPKGSTDKAIELRRIFKICGVTAPVPPNGSFQSLR